MGKSAGRSQKVDRRASGGPWWSIEDCEVSLIEKSVFRANLHRLHAGLGFGPGLEHAVVDYRRCGGRLLIDNGAFLGSCIPYDVVFRRNGGLRKGRSDRECHDGA
jgi:hypothetical protein